VGVNGKYLAELREDRGMSQREAAEKIGLSHSFICLLEAGKRTPSLGALSRIAKFYKVKLSDLIK
jgi:HTH-type transcriptional repressor of puuD